MRPANNKRHSALARVLGVLALMLPIALMAQQPATLPIPYSCGFEDAAELSNWVLNPHTQGTAKDQWVVGTATHSEGQHSLYISTDGGQSPAFGDSKNIVMAYRRIKFPETGQTENYELSFDWRCAGIENQSQLQLVLVPEVAFQTDWDAVPRVGDDVSSISNTLRKQFLAQINDGDTRPSCNALYGSPQWRNASVNVKISKANAKLTFVLMFVWTNGNVDKQQCQLGACIDNIQLCSTRAPKPKNMEVTAHCEDSTLVVSFSSILSSFNVKYKRSDSNSWHAITDIDGNDENLSSDPTDATRKTYVIPEKLPEAAYDIIVNGNLDAEDTTYVSAYSVAYNVLMYCPENHCVNIMDLDDPRLVCTVGNIHTGTPFDHKGYVNFGPDAMESRQTIHTDPNEFDPRTDYGLRCVPKGELGAVRLGNWNTGYEAETMTYSYVVDSASQGILLIKYAVVLNQPGPSCGDPGFSMLILDEDGNEIDDDCGQADFSYSSAASAGWNTAMEGAVVWKDWTYVGVDLRKYNGQTLRIQLTTKDCGGGGHFGYAYFTMDCISASIKTENCGADAEIKAEAPEGFLYEWRDETGKVWGHEPTLTVPPGRHTYTCKLTYMESPDCSFEIATQSAPRYPVPAFDTVYAPVDCKNIVKFKNTSHIMNYYAGYENHTSEACNEYIWRIRSLRDETYKQTTNPNPTYTCRAEGDTLEVILTAFIGLENACDSTIIDTIIVGSIVGQTDTITLETCEGNPKQIGGQWREQSGQYTEESRNFAGCPMIKLYDLTVHPRSKEDTIYARTCSSSKYMWNGIRCDTTGIYTSRQKNRWGCDSIVHLNLQITEKVIIEADSLVALCADADRLVINFNVLRGAFDSLLVRFDDVSRTFLPDTLVRDTTVTAVTYRLGSGVIPGFYTVHLTFYQPGTCGNLEINLPFEIRYSSSVIQQKWNDVLALLNSNYNGGYTFTAYQWYKNGQPIFGATESYLYEPLDFNADYSVQLTRSDGVKMFACSVRPVDRSGMIVASYPTMVALGQSAPIRLPQPATASFVSMVGTVYATASLREGDNRLTAPQVGGVYILLLTFEDGTRQTQYVLVK